MSVLTIKQIQSKLSKLDLIDANTNEPVLYSVFKNRASIHRYKGRFGTKKIVFVGVPKDNLFGFYAAFANDTDVNVMREAYKNLQDLAKGDITPHVNEQVQWGNCGVPLAYGKLRVR